MISKEEKIKLARERRLQKAGISKQELEKNIKEEFRKYFIRLKRILNLDSSMEKVIWLHLKSAGFAKKELFDEGIRHFGYKI